MKAIVNTSVLMMMDAPKYEGTVVDEALYGMVVELLEQPAEGWYKIRTHYRYEGYVPACDLIIDDEAAARWEAYPKKVVYHKNCCDILAAPSVTSYHLNHLTRGCIVAVAGEAKEGWTEILLADGRTGYIQASILGAYHSTPCSTDEDDLRKAIIDAAMLYRGTHYRWGGKSPMGIDCSGLVSMAYMLCGINIYRDANIVEGFPIHPIDKAKMKPGDLLFFPGHVTMYLGDGRYCHSTGRYGDDGFTVNSLDPEAPDFREDLPPKLIAVGSYF